MMRNYTKAGYSLSNEELRQLQMIELEMLVELDRICRKNHIKYSLDGGTLLGAIRHDGFIPWDDDADVVMTRAEYERFFIACKKDLNNERFFLQEFRTDFNYRWGYAKLRRNGTIFLREGQEHGQWHQGVFIDIFIYDEVPDNFILRRVHLFFCYCIRKGLYSVVGMKKADSFLLRFWYRILYSIPRKFWEKSIEKIAEAVNNGQHELIRHLTYPYRRARYGLPRECFDNYMEKDFEGHIFMIFQKYDTYLSRLYGNYMELPPEKERKVHPITRLKLL